MSGYQLTCEACRRDVADAPFAARCADCPGLFRGRYDAPGFDLLRPPASLWDYAPLLPVRDARHRVSLGEGATPLLRARSAPDRAVWLKNEAANPTGSQKDRAVSVALSKARELGLRRAITASTGSSGLACAAYSARAGLDCIVLVPEGTPPERLVPMAAHGATLVEVAGGFRETARLIEAVDADPSWYKASTNRRTNPFQADGTRTIAFEIVAQLGGVPDWVVVPVGGGGTLAGLWRGFRELLDWHAIATLPRMAAVQPAGLDSVRVSLAEGRRTEAEIAAAIEGDRPTVMLNLKAGRRSDLADVVAAVVESSGTALAVTDAEALDWQARLARTDGILAEPSAVAGLAALERLAADGTIGPADRVVVLVTGSGLRQPGILAPPVVTRVAPTDGLAALEAALISGLP